MTDICKALYAYNGVGGEKITTLNFEAGEMINVIFSGNTGWWEGEKDGARGWFPASYVTIVQQEEDVDSNYSDEWREVATDEGEIYYVNTSTNETSWDIPKPVEAKANERRPVRRSATISTNNTNSNSIHLNLPLKSDDQPDKAQSQPNSPTEEKKESPEPADTVSLHVSDQSTPSPPIQRSKTFSSPPSLSSSQITAKPNLKVVNGISFPGEVEAREQNLLHPGKFSYCDYFWADKVENNNCQSGFVVLYQKLLKGKQMCKEMAEFFKAREAIENQYAKSLASLANGALANNEDGTLGEAWKQVKSTTLLESRIHQDFASKIKNEVSQRFLDERERDRKDMKKLEASIADLRKQVQSRYQTTEKIKQNLLEKTKDYENKVSSSKHTKDEVSRARRKSTRQAEDLAKALESYNQQRQQWFEELVTSSLLLERHEGERIESVKNLLTQYSKTLRESSDGCSDSCDIINEQMKQIDIEKDRELWVRKNTTGSIRPVDLVL